MQGKPIATAVAAANMSERSARNWRSGELPSDRKQTRHWRTHPDPFTGVWEEEIEPLLAADRGRVLQAPTILQWLQNLHPDRFPDSRLRTLQRRIRDWRALNGPDREVFFPQVHPPGREAQADFSGATKLRVTIAGQAFPHLLFEFVLSYSGWRHVQIAYSETFMALKSGLQAALWELGGCPRVIRTDNLSAATHELRRRRGRDLNWTYRQLLEHYGLESTRSNARKAHENGVVEQAHRRIKESIAQQLVLRGSKDFASVAAYEEFLGEIVADCNRRAEPKVLIELEHLRPLPASPLPDYVSYRARVSKWSTIRVSNRTYTITPAPDRAPGRGAALPGPCRRLLPGPLCRAPAARPRQIAHPRQLPPRDRIAGEEAGRLPATAGASSSSRPRPSASPGRPSADGAPGAGPISSTCASCSWRQGPWRPTWSARSSNCSLTAGASTTRTSSTWSSPRPLPYPLEVPRMIRHRALQAALPSSFLCQ